MVISCLTRETKISKTAKGPFTKCLFIPIFDHVEFPHWMSVTERPGLAGILNCVWHWQQQLIQQQIQTDACDFSTTALMAGPDPMAKERIPHPEHRKRFKGTTPNFLDIHNISLILLQVCSTLLVESVLPCSHRHRPGLKKKHWLWQRDWNVQARILWLEERPLFLGLYMKFAWKSY